MIAFTNGPLFLVARRWYDRPGTWEDPFIRPAIVLATLVAVAATLTLALERRLARPTLALVAGAVFTAMAVWSKRWSVRPDLTEWRSLVYVGLLIAAWGIASLAFEEMLALLAGVSAISVVVSVLFVVGSPRIGIDGAGDWRGVYTNPNSLGPLCALAIIAGLAVVWVSSQRYLRAGALGVIVLSGITLLGTRSVTAVLALVVSLFAATTMVAIRHLHLSGRVRQSWRLLAATGATAVLIVAVLGESVWNHDNFATRRELWGHVWERAMVLPWKGFGFFAFWDEPSQLYPNLLARSGSAHNSAVEAVLGLGFGGLVAVLIIGLAALVDRKSVV